MFSGRRVLWVVSGYEILGGLLGILLLWPNVGHGAGGMDLLVGFVPVLPFVLILVAGVLLGLRPFVGSIASIVINAAQLIRLEGFIVYEFLVLVRIGPTIALPKKVGFLGAGGVAFRYGTKDTNDLLLQVNIVALFVLLHLLWFCFRGSGVKPQRHVAQSIVTDHFDTVARSRIDVVE